MARLVRFPFGYFMLQLSSSTNVLPDIRHRTVLSVIKAANVEDVACVLLTASLSSSGAAYGAVLVVGERTIASAAISPSPLSGQSPRSAPSGAEITAVVESLLSRAKEDVVVQIATDRTSLALRREAEDSSREVCDSMITRQRVKMTGGLRFNTKTRRSKEAARCYTIFGYKLAADFVEYEFWMEKLHPGDRQQVHDEIRAAFGGQFIKPIDDSMTNTRVTFLGEKEGEWSSTK